MSIIKSTGNIGKISSIRNGNLMLSLGENYITQGGVSITSWYNVILNKLISKSVKIDGVDAVVIKEYSLVNETTVKSTVTIIIANVPQTPIIKMINKGDLIKVEGGYSQTISYKMGDGSFIDANAYNTQSNKGTASITNWINVNELEILFKKGERTSNNTSTTPAYNTSGLNFTEDDVPF